jgi:hypothetical protein
MVAPRPRRGAAPVALVLAVIVLEDPEDLDAAKGSPQPAQGRLLVGSSSAMGVGRLPPWRLVTAAPQVQVDPAALALELVDLALAVVLAAGFEGEDL